MKVDLEATVLHTGLRQLSRISPEGRRRVLAYWCARAESLPLTDGNGKLLVEHPVESEPPMIKFINDRHETAAAQPDA
jgi:hypothetical protein